MTFEDVKINCYNKEYALPDASHLRRSRVSPNHIFDEDKSVKWNREQVVIHNDAINQRIQEVELDRINIHNKYRTHLMQAAQDEYGINENQFNIIWNKVSEFSEFDYICSGQIEDIEYLIDFICEVREAGR